MIQSRCAWRRRWTARALPRVQSDVMMITARRKKRRLFAVALRHLKAQYITPEPERAFKVGNLQVDMADADSGINRFGS